MDISQIHDWINFVTNKEQAAYFSPKEIDDSLDRAQMKYFNELYSSYATSEKTQDALSPFKAQYNFLTDDSAGGILNLPATYQYLLGLQTVVQDGGNTIYPSVKVIAEDALAQRLSSHARKVSASKPIATITGKAKIQLYPKQAMAGSAFYLRRPVAPVYGYTIVSGDITYNAGTSTQMEWGESELSEIMIRAIEYLGVSMSD